jgi:hypothetical protein
MARTGDSRFLPFGFAQGRNDSQKGKSKRSRFPEGMTERKAKARATASAKARAKGKGNSNSQYRDPSTAGFALRSG